MRTISAFLLLPLAGACTQTLDGAPCPCADGYECCAITNVCLRPGAVCKPEAQSGRGGVGGEDGAGAGAPTGGRNAAGAGDGPAGGGVGAESARGGAEANGSAAAGQTAAAGSTGAGGAVAGGGGFAGAASAPTAGAVSAGGTEGDPSSGGAGGNPKEEPTFALVATQHNDTSRTGANLEETALDASNVRVGSFGELSRRPLHGATFAQPLVAPGVELGDGSRRDVLIVATMANVVYALDARYPERPPFWTRDLGPPVELPTTEPLPEAGIWHEVGILGTPVLSLEENALYVVAATSVDDLCAHTAYKLDLATGAVLKSAAVASDGFDPAIEAQRAALTLSDGVLFVPFGPYKAGSAASGWVFAFDRDLVLLGHVNLGAPSGAGVTMSGDGPAVGAGSALYFTTGLGVEGDDAQPGAYGARVLELRLAKAPPIVERLLPEAAQSGSDELASSGPLLLPGEKRLLVAGQHRLYVVDTEESAASPPLQALRVSGANDCVDVSFSCKAEPSSPVFWPGAGPTPVPRVFVWPPSDVLRAFALKADAASFECEGGDAPCASAFSAMAADSYGASKKMLADSAHLSVSSNGAESGTGVVWALQPYVSDEPRSPEGILRAFDAEDLELLWSSERAKEPLGPLAQGAVPTVSGGRVFVGGADGLSNKTIFGDSEIGGPPALANYDDEFLVVAWPFATPQNQGFQLAWSSDGVSFDDADANTFRTRFYIYQPALTSNGKRLYLAWTTDEGRVEVAAANHPSFDAPEPLLDAEGDSPFDGEATSAPALAYGGGRLFLAVHTQFGLELVSSADGVSFEPASHITLSGYVSGSAPLLSYENGKLYLATSDYHGQLDLFVSQDEGGQFDEPSRLPMLTAGHPALVSFDDPEPRQVLVWADAASDGAIEGPIMAASRSGSAGEFTRAQLFGGDAAERAISAARFRGNAYIAWMGTGDVPHPNVARYSAGGLVTYGLLKP